MKTECNCDMPYWAYKDWLTEQGFSTEGLEEEMEFFGDGWGGFKLLSGKHSEAYFGMQYGWYGAGLDRYTGCWFPTGNASYCYYEIH